MAKGKRRSSFKKGSGPRSRAAQGKMAAKNSSGIHRGGIKR